MKSMWRTLNELFDIMPSGARRFYLIYSILTGMLAGLDTVALALVVVTMSAFASGKPIDIPLIGELPESATIWIVIIVCALIHPQRCACNFVALGRYSQIRWLRIGGR